MMVNSENYWLLRGVNSFGKFQSREIPEAKAFFLKHFSQQREEIGDKKIQQQLFSWYRNQQNKNQARSKLCLKCFVSNCIYQTCLSTEKKYRETYGLSKNDLFPLVLDPVSQNNIVREGISSSLVNEIIDTFDLEKNSNLSTWTSIKVKGNREYKLVLKFYGIVEITNWLILVKTTPGNLIRKLRNQGYSEFEIQESGKLLEAFHQIYRTQILERRETINKQREAEGKGKSNKPYPPPTGKQLKEIAELLNSSKELESQKLLDKLTYLANILRNHGISGQNNMVLPLRENLDNPNSQLDNELEIVIQNNIEEVLLKVTKEVIKSKVDFFLNKRTPQIQKANNLIVALKLFYCDGYSMNKIAPEIGYSAQYQVSRLLKLQEFKKDVSRKAISTLKERLKLELTPFVNAPEALTDLDKKIQNFLEVAINRVIDKKETVNHLNTTRKVTSFFYRIVSQCVINISQKQIIVNCF